MARRLTLVAATLELFFMKLNNIEPLPMETPENSVTQGPPQPTYSFATEHLIQGICLLSCTQHCIPVAGIVGSSSTSPGQSITSLQIDFTSVGKKINLTAIALPKVTYDLPVSPVPFDLLWTHLSGLV